MAKNKGTKKKDFVSVNMFESFMGRYNHLKQTEKKVKALTGALKERLSFSEEKRHVFSKYGLVGRYVAKNIYETDVVGLNEYLNDLGLLLHVVEIDNKKIVQPENFLYFDMLKEFRLPETFYVKPSFNKVARALNDISNFEITDQWNNNDIVRSLAIMKPQVKKLNREYERLKRKISLLPEIQEMAQLPKELREPIKHRYGSLSVVVNQPRYDIIKIYESFGEDFLIELGSPNGKILENWILNGTITKKEVEQFKTIKDIRLEFSVMTLDDEKKLFEMLDRNQKTAAYNRMGA